MKNSDLHVHSYYSDGDLSPSEVVKRAKQKGVKNLALSDHNSIEGISEAIKEGKRQGINIIPAIELLAEEDEVLGYFIDYKNKKFKKEVEKIQKSLTERVKKRIIKLNRRGVKVSFDDLIKKYHPNKRFMDIHIIKYLSSKGLGDIRTLWAKYISTDKETDRFYVPAPAIEIIKLIRKYGGVPVLAHPWASPESKELLKEENFKKLINAGLKGIEIDNGDRDERRDEQTLEKIRELAKKYNLIITSGSDFHGDYLVKPNRPGLGECNCDEKVVKQLKSLSK